MCSWCPFFIKDRRYREKAINTIKLIINMLICMCGVAYQPLCSLWLVFFMVYVGNHYWPTTVCFLQNSGWCQSGSSMWCCGQYKGHGLQTIELCGTTLCISWKLWGREEREQSWKQCEQICFCQTGQWCVEICKTKSVPEIQTDVVKLHQQSVVWRVCTPCTRRVPACHLPSRLVFTVATIAYMRHHIYVQHHMRHHIWCQDVHGTIAYLETKLICVSTS